MATTSNLSKTLSTTAALLVQYLDILNSTPRDTPSNVANAAPLLPLLSDSARLLKAQVTKLSLLAINKPFTPSAVSKVVSEITTTCLPAMMSAVQICDAQPSAYGSVFSAEVRARVRRIMREILSLIREVEAISQEETNGKDKKNVGVTGRDSLSSTGVVWNGCDELTSLAIMGVPGLAVQKAEAFRDTIKDAIAELQEWREGGDEGNEGTEDNLLDSDDEGVDGDRDSLDDIFNAAHSLPSDRPELKALTSKAEDKLKKVVILYTALLKRRLKPMSGPFHVPTSEENVEVVETILSTLKSLPDMTDELASMLYELDEEGAKNALDEIITAARTCATKTRLNVAGEEDEFTTWSDKWKDAIK